MPNHADGRTTLLGRGCSSGVEHNLAKVGVVGSNPIARSKYRRNYSVLLRYPPVLVGHANFGEAWGKHSVVIRPIFRRRIWSLLASARPRRGDWDRRSRDVTPQPSSGPKKFLAVTAKSGHERPIP